VLIGFLDGILVGFEYGRRGCGEGRCGKRSFEERGEYKNLVNQTCEIVERCCE
jgi:hypothetical protein